MRYLSKFLQRAGLVSTLLTGGVLGGLMAPLPSDSAGPILPPELTIQIDNLPATTATGATLPGTSILGSAVACNAADQGLGYTACYSILTNTGVAYAGDRTRLYRVQNASGATARLRVGDNLGQDNFSLVGVQFVPVNSPTQAVGTLTNWGNPDANTNEQHSITIRMRTKLNGPVNVGNATGQPIPNSGTPPKTVGQVTFGMASGGEFRAHPLATLPATTPNYCGTSTTPGALGNVKCNTVGNSVSYTGTGIFSGTQSVDILSSGSGDTPPANNSRPLSYTVPATNASNSVVGYDGLSNPKVGQVDPRYPRFDCIDKDFPTVCQPDITLTMAVTLKGPDTFVVLNGVDCPSGLCNYGQDKTLLSRIAAFLSFAIPFVDKWEMKHPNLTLRTAIDNAKAFLVSFNSPPSDPNCPGTVYVKGQNTFQGVLSANTIVADGGVIGDPGPEPIHEYRMVPLPGATWDQARAHAKALGDGWDLATITSQPEQNRINDLLGPPPTGGTFQYWVGGFQQTGEGVTEPGGNWKWINGEGRFWDSMEIPGQFQCWGNDTNGPNVGLQPDNAGIEPPQNHLSLDNRYGWCWDDNDKDLYAILGYVAERVSVSGPPVIF